MRKWRFDSRHSAGACSVPRILKAEPFIRASPCTPPAFSHSRSHMAIDPCIPAAAPSRRCFRPPAEPALQESLNQQPKPCPSLSKDTYYRFSPASEDEHEPGKRIFRQLLLTEPCQRIDPLASVRRLDRHQYPHLRGDLDHPATSRHARSSAPSPARLYPSTAPASADEEKSRTRGCMSRPL